MRLSPSSINMFLKCPGSYWFNQEGKPKLRLRELEFGSLVHRIIRRYYETIPVDITPKSVRMHVEKCASELTPVVTEVLDHYLGAFVRFESDRLTWDLDPRPVAVEREFSREFAGLELHGVVDALFRRDSKLVVVDWKTGYSSNPSITKELAVQGLVYKVVTGADEVYFIFLRSGVYRRLPDYDLSWFEELVLDVKRRIEGNERTLVIGDHCESCVFNLYCNMHRRGMTLWDL